MKRLTTLLAFPLLGFMWSAAIFGGAFIAGLLSRIAVLAFKYGYSLIP
jgi:hypothetical protein